jgi:GntR family transcriptional regulator, transcriptional repressor for pyruvate dehydrogenase complex
MLVAHRIVSDIVRAGLPPGSALQSEREMLLHYEVGRGTLREAVRFLELQGVLNIKIGPGGGPVVTTPDARHLANALSLQLQFAGTPFRAVVEARLLLEPVIAAHGAGRPNVQAIEELGQCVDRMVDRLDDPDTFLKENARFHDLVALASGNLLLWYILSSLHWIIDGSVLGVDYPEKQRRAVVTAHRGIYEAIRDGHAERAESSMRAHMEEYVTYLERRYPRVMNQVVPWEPIP